MFPQRKSNALSDKEFPVGYSIGYGRSFITRRPTRIATIPVGYGDGFGCFLSNQGEALMGGKRVPIAGRVSMDICTLGVSHIPGCAVGDEVVLLGAQGNERITAEEIAAKAHSISYEVLCALGKRVPRVFFYQGRADRVEPSLRRIFLPDEEKSIARIGNIIRHCFHTWARIEYTKALRNAPFMIGCALDNEQLAAFFEDKRCEYRWLLNSDEKLVTERDFKVNRVRIDGQDIPIIRVEHTARGYEVWCGAEEFKKKLNRQTRLSMEIETKKLKSNRLFSAYLIYPTREMEIAFHYGETGIKNVRNESFFAGKHPYPEVVRERGKSITLKLGNDSWIFPTSGVTFFWDL
ncbi:MAG: alanine racemase C-terminal domain-containing protein [Pseudomonadota bacterium]